MFLNRKEGRRGGREGGKEGKKGKWKKELVEHKKENYNKQKRKIT